MALTSERSQFNTSPEPDRLAECATTTRIQLCHPHHLIQMRMAVVAYYLTSAGKSSIQVSFSRQSYGMHNLGSMNSGSLCSRPKCTHLPAAAEVLGSELTSMISIAQSDRPYKNSCLMFSKDRVKIVDITNAYPIANVSPISNVSNEGGNGLIRGQPSVQSHFKPSSQGGSSGDDQPLLPQIG